MGKSNSQNQNSPRKPNKFEWMGYEWMCSPKWGTTHPDNKNTWYSRDAVNVINNELHLTVHRLPKNIKDDPHYVDEFGAFDSTKPYKPYGIGLVRTTGEFGYGTYEIECMLPEGCNLWPSFWFSGDNSWPPEIDVFEGYTSNIGSYRSNLIMYRVEPNVHYSDRRTGEHKQIGAKKVLSLIIKKGKTNKFKMVWKPDSISIYYNGIRVRKVTNDDILYQFRENKMHPILNLMVNESFNDYNLAEEPTMVVKNFKYTPL